MTDRTRLLQIGEVAERVGVSLRTVRYYEEMGLVTPSQRTEGGFRLYSEEDVERLQLVKQMKPLGLSIHQMTTLMHARDVLQDPTAGTDEQQDALAVVEELASEAAERVQELRGQLERAEGFSDQVRRELKRHKRKLRERLTA